MNEKPGDGEKLHDRFILAPVGGVNFSVGLDTGEPGQITLVTRLTAAAHETIWKAYQHGKPTAALDLAPGFPLTLKRSRARSLLFHTLSPFSSPCNSSSTTTALSSTPRSRSPR